MMRQKNKEPVWWNTGYRKSILIGMRKHWQIYLLIILPVLWYVLFAYYPMAGLQLAFKSYKVRDGIWGSPFNGIANFQIMLSDANFFRAVGRTLQINVLRLLLCFPAPIFLALMFNELRIGKFKQILQTIFTFPNFLSWVIVAALFNNVFQLDGLINGVITALGGKEINFVGSTKLFQPFLYGTDIWKNAGYSAIIYIAAISGIDQDQYEAARIDGANRIQRLLYITLPNLLPTISVMFILTCGGLMSAGFDQVFNMSNPATKNVAEILDMYIYRITFQGSVDYGFSTAVSLFRSVINMILLVIADRGSKAMGGNGLFV